MEVREQYVPPNRPLFDEKKALIQHMSWTQEQGKCLWCPELRLLSSSWKTCRNSLQNSILRVKNLVILMIRLPELKNTAPFLRKLL